MLKRLLLTLAILASPLVLVPVTSAAEIFDKKLCGTGRANDSAVCQDKNLPQEDGKDVNPLFGPQGVLTRVINILTIIVGIAAIIMIILAGLKYITSGSNPQEVTAARERVIYALVALAIAASAQVLVRFILGRL